MNRGSDEDVKLLNRQESNVTPADVFFSVDKDEISMIVSFSLVEFNRPVVFSTYRC